MKINLEQFKTLVEAGDVSAIEKHILTQVLEKGDISAAAKANALVNSELDSLKDTHSTSALETWKTNHLQKLIDDEVAKRNPQETPEQKRIRDLEQKLEAQEKENKRTALQKAALEYATSTKGYDAKFATKWIEKFLGEDETATNATLDDFKTDFDAFVQMQVVEKLKGSKRNPGGNGGASEEVSYGAKLAQSTIESEKAAGQTNYFE